MLKAYQTQEGSEVVSRGFRGPTVNLRHRTDPNNGRQLFEFVTLVCHIPFPEDPVSLSLKSHLTNMQVHRKSWVSCCFATCSATGLMLCSSGIW